MGRGILLILELKLLYFFCNINNIDVQFCLEIMYKWFSSWRKVFKCHLWQWRFSIKKSSEMSKNDEKTVLFMSYVFKRKDHLKWTKNRCFSLRKSIFSISEQRWKCKKNIFCQKTTFWDLTLIVPVKITGIFFMAFLGAFENDMYFRYPYILHDSPY